MKIRSVKFSALMNTIFTCSNLLFGIIILPYVSRVLSVEGNGAVSFAQNAGMWISACCLLGIPTYGIRECARVRDDPVALATLVKELLTIITIITIPVMMLFCCSIVLVPQFAAEKILMYIFAINALLTSFGVNWLFQGVEQYGYITGRNAVFKLISLFLIFLFVKHQNDYIIYGALLAFATCASNIFNIIHMNRIINWNYCCKINLKRHLKPIFYFSQTTLSGYVYTVLDVVLLGLLTSSTYQIGLYQLAAKIKTVTASLIVAASTATIPRLSYYNSHKNTRKFVSLVEKNIRLVFIVGLFATCLILLFPNAIIGIISSEKFLDAKDSLCILSFVIILSSLNQVCINQILIPLGQERKAAVPCIAAVFVSVPLNFILDPIWGSVGASVALLLAETVVFIISVFFCRHILFLISWGKIIYEIVLGAIISSVITFFLAFFLNQINLYLSFVISLCFFSCVFFVWLFLNKEELTFGTVNSILEKLGLGKDR